MDHALVDSLDRSGLFSFLPPPSLPLSLSSFFLPFSTSFPPPPPPTFPSHSLLLFFVLITTSRLFVLAPLPSFTCAVRLTVCLRRRATCRKLHDRDPTLLRIRLLIESFTFSPSRVLRALVASIASFAHRAQRLR